MSVAMGCFLILILGCKTPTPVIKPPKQPEEFNLPPEGAYVKPDWDEKLLIHDLNGTKRKDDSLNGGPGARPGGPGMSPAGGGMSNPGGNGISR